LTKYEFVRIRGIRLEQLYQSATPYVFKAGWRNHPPSPERIFIIEFLFRKLPVIVKRTTATGVSKYYKLGNLAYPLIDDDAELQNLKEDDYNSSELLYNEIKSVQHPLQDENISRVSGINVDTDYDDILHYFGEAKGWPETIF
jgi:hypothetical protein